MAMYSNTSPLFFGFARTAATGTPHSAPNGYVAIIMSILAVEALLNELIHHVQLSALDPLPPQLRLLRALTEAADLTSRSATLLTKLKLIGLACDGAPIDFGKQPLQDFGQLLRLRDWLVHNRPERLIVDLIPSASGDALQFQQQELHRLGEFLVSRGLIDRPAKEYPTSVDQLLLQGKVAAWAFNTVARTVRLLDNLLPTDGWRTMVSFSLDLAEVSP